uniref:RING-type E3 ubiquitin transferase n=1 Tax=Peromyscus maniculatus bairdii TaxID=230844 RepID=A0A8C8UPA3_PERMB
MALSKPDDLTLDDCQCLLCMEFLIEPITLPCNHTVCKSCFKALLRKTFLSCPFCRTRVSSWARYHTHISSLINKELWERIQAQYPEECSRRSPEEDNGLGNIGKWEGQAGTGTEWECREEDTMIDEDIMGIGKGRVLGRLSGIYKVDPTLVCWQWSRRYLDQSTLVTSLANNLAVIIEPLFSD